MCHYTISPIRAKSQKCLLLLFPMLHLTAPRAQILVFCARTARKRGFQSPKAHKNHDFVLGRAKNWGPEGQKRTKTPFLCSRSQKSGVPKAKNAQKPRFCARNARKWGFRRAKAHKNLDFVLEMPENGGPEGQKRTKMPFMCSKIKGLASRRATVAFLQITAHTSEMQIPHNQIINFYQRAR